MAIIGKCKKLDWVFSQICKQNEIYEYLIQAIDPRSPIHKRISGIKQAGEYPMMISGNIRVIEQAYHLKSPKQAFFETHRKFVDFQLIVEGYEYMYIGDKSEFDVFAPYDEQKDLIIYRNSHIPYLRDIYTESSNQVSGMTKIKYLLPTEEYSQTPQRTQILLRAGDLAIFMPDDVHAGGLELSSEPFTPSPHLVKKSVLKVPLSLLQI